MTDFKANIKSKVKKIPDNNLQEPELSIIGPAIESSKFYISERVIRDLFSNLIASAMDNRKTNDVHHSFVELIKQMSPKDAILFKFLCNQKVIPAVRYKYIRDNSKAGDFLSDSIISNSPIDLNSTEISLNNLERIGLLKIDIGLNSYTNENLYESFDDPKIINNYIQKYKKETYKKVRDVFNMINHFGIENISRYYNLSINEVYTIVKPACIEYDKGYIEITSFGKAFAKCCF
ncbi:DUF4393 domain-containing protein [Staphylococcus aureus]|uniref:DUF4393 domain-containing protein n=1 Tax=Staphylococcus aureus TaxID=1280 RepID=UPI0026E04A13|nr:DUF4393 domain-containing protein [Staphylococcus aureus]